MVTVSTRCEIAGQRSHPSKIRGLRSGHVRQRWRAGCLLLRSDQAAHNSPAGGWSGECVKSVCSLLRLVAVIIKGESHAPAVLLKPSGHVVLDSVLVDCVYKD